MKLRGVSLPPGGDKYSVYRIWGADGEGGLQMKHCCEADGLLEIAPFELFPAGIHKALNAAVPAGGRPEGIGRLPRFACNDMLPLVRSTAFTRIGLVFPA